VRHLGAKAHCPKSEMPPRAFAYRRRHRPKPRARATWVKNLIPAGTKRNQERTIPLLPALLLLGYRISSPTCRWIPYRRTTMTTTNWQWMEPEVFVWFLWLARKKGGSTANKSTTFLAPERKGKNHCLNWLATLGVVSNWSLTLLPFVCWGDGRRKYWAGISRGCCCFSSVAVKRNAVKRNERSAVNLQIRSTASTVK
jgi:hypothetical protein